jgi:hypothetical protein
MRDSNHLVLFTNLPSMQEMDRRLAILTGDLLRSRAVSESVAAQRRCILFVSLLVVKGLSTEVESMQHWQGATGMNNIKGRVFHLKRSEGACHSHSC